MTHRSVLAVAVEKFLDRDVGLDPKAAAAQGRHEAQCLDLFRNPNAAGEQQA
jgi:hypothetical protein